MSDSMTPPPCPTCGRRASRRTGYVRTTDKMACIDPFHDAGDWGPALLEALKDAASSLEALSCAGIRGAAIQDYSNVRGFANSRAIIARDALAAVEGRKEEENVTS